MTQTQKVKRYCIPCNTYGTHTSLDHRNCKTKRTQIQNKIKLARENRKTEETSNKRNLELIKQTLEISNHNVWPELTRNNEQYQKSSLIILMALLDESHTPG